MRFAILHEVCESVASALDLGVVHVELARLGAGSFSEPAHQHESLQVQDDVVELTEVLVQLRPS